MRLTLTCEHGTRTVEIDEGREGLGNIHSIGGKRSFAQSFVDEVMPRCPYCLQKLMPQFRVSLDADGRGRVLTESATHKAFGTHGYATQP